MSFWSGEKLRARLSDIVEAGDPTRIDCSAYTLTIGPQVYVSPTEAAKEPAERTIRNLAESEALTIPPGQFAFLLTEERIRVPNDAIAWISIKARLKLRGLVNVSGFHVDPGYAGRLIFGVLNAGPATIHLRRGDACFLIWYADLDRSSDVTKASRGFDDVPSELVSNIAREFKTIEGLSKRMDDLKNEQSVTRALAGFALAVFLGLVVRDVWPATSSSLGVTPRPAATASLNQPPSSSARRNAAP